jgi:hypothetical protein
MAQKKTTKAKSKTKKTVEASEEKPVKGSMVSWSR